MMKRVVVGKSLGFIVGLIGFVCMPYVFPEVSMMTRVGILFWYTLMGGMIAVFGVIDYHPVLKMRLNAWVRGVILGGSMNLALVLVGYAAIQPLMQSATIFTGMSPFWLVLEGAVVAVVIDLVLTKKTGEGSSLCQSTVA